MQRRDVPRPRRVDGALTTTYVLAALAVVAMIVFLGSSFALAFGEGRAVWAMLVAGPLTIVLLVAGIVVSPFTRGRRRPS
ncbi:hypothetical protein GGQ22_15365 [Nocardioides sp. zg-579]|uniref:Uncharacterized protein n=1 Tax=Nocardioides marmotae TaxID=2663857 RepID=A0A6I3JEA6_9ACTN|nr:hypothetical protein [Nocardioides marmotae]MCR6032802.1 hypothetical protein [Gordonia jinghuaiqii]MTB96452.1 hypothetical protein [Nocardioides marmotae]QKE02023.1 hypothetical protein HPC71_13765 [Nocardioides marmotae]